MEKKNRVDKPAASSSTKTIEQVERKLSASLIFQIVVADFVRNHSVQD